MLLELWHNVYRETVIIMDFNEVMKQLRDIVPSDNFQEQPKTARNDLINLEKKYSVNTSDFTEKKVDISHIPLNVRDDWLETLDTYFFYDGLVEDINHLNC